MPLSANSGVYVHLIAAVLGLTAILATSSMAFTIVKWAGAAYLVYLGAKAIAAERHSLKIEGCTSQNINKWAVFRQGFISDVLNPKVALCYVSILPQFTDPHSTDPDVQLVLLGVTLNVIGIVTNIKYAYFCVVLDRKAQGKRANILLAKQGTRKHFLLR